MHSRLQLAPSAPQAGLSPRAHPQITIVLADDQQLVRRSLRLLLESEHDFEVVADAGDLNSAVRHVNERAPHVLSLNLQMSNGGSLDLIRRLRAEVPDTQIVILTMDDNATFVQAALAAGACGCVLNDNARTELPLAIRAAANGERYLSPRLAAGISALKRSIEEAGLSAAETDVLRLIALGYTNSEIADELHFSRRTVEAQRRRVHRKLGLHKRSELVRYALEQRLVGG